MGAILKNMTETHLEIPEIKGSREQGTEIDSVVAEELAAPMTNREAEEVCAALKLKGAGLTRFRAAAKMSSELQSIGVHRIGVSEHVYSNANRDELLRKCRKRRNKADREDEDERFLAFAHLEARLWRDRDEAVGNILKIHAMDPSNQPKMDALRDGPMKGVAIQINNVSKEA